MLPKRFARAVAPNKRQSSSLAWRALPTELVLEILNKLDSPRDVLAFISSDSLALSCYMKYRQSILRSWQKKLKDRLVDPALGPDEYESATREFQLTARLRDMRRRQEFHVKDKLHRVKGRYPMDRYGTEVANLVESTMTRGEFPQSLGFLCELSGFFSDADEFISFYGRHEWSKQVVAAGFHAAGAIIEPPPDTSPLRVTPSERCKLYIAIAFFEAQSLAKFYCGRFLTLGRHESIWTNVDTRTNMKNMTDFVVALRQEIFLHPKEYLDHPGGQDDVICNLVGPTTSKVPPVAWELTTHSLSHGIQPLLRLMRSSLVREKALDSLWCDHKRRYSVAMTPHPHLNLRPAYAYLDRVPSALWDEWRMAELQVHASSFADQES